MARRDRPADDGGALRRCLLADAEDFRRAVCDIAIGDPAMADYAWWELSKPVDLLTAGEPCTLHRGDLPDDHPSRGAGWPLDLMLLGADDVLTRAK